MKELIALFKARNIEFYRDFGSLSWAFLFPLLIIIGCAVAFSDPDTTVFKIGYHGQPDSVPLLNAPYVNAVEFTDLDKGLERLKYHQLDLLVSTENDKRYWINSESTKSEAAETLFLAGSTDFNRGQTSGRAVRYVDWVIPGVLGMNLMFGALYGVGYVIVRYRLNGVLKRLQVTPISALQFLTAQMASRLIIVVGINSLIFIGCLFSLDLVVRGSYLDMFLITVLGSLSMVSIGLLVACRTANEELANGLLNIATWPMMFLSEVWFSLDDSPDWLKACADFLPLTHIVKATRAVMIDGDSLLDVSPHLLWLAILTVVCLALAARLFRWSRVR